MASHVQWTLRRAFNLSETTLLESKKLLSRSAGIQRKQALEFQVVLSNSEYQKDFEAMRWTWSERCRDYTPDARIMSF